MIILPEADMKSEGFLDAKVVSEAQTVQVNRVQMDEHHDPPPAYTIPAPPPAPPPKVHVHGPSPPSDNKPTNQLSLIRRDGRIRGSFVIDPRLKVPAQMLAPLEADETDETRRNLYLHSQDGSIDADVWVLSDEDADCKCRGKVRLGVSTQDGNVSLRLHSTAGSPYTPRTPLKLSLHTDDGHVSLSLPRVFRGPLTIRIGDGRMRLSRALSAATTIFSKSKGISRCFVGDFAESGWADAPGEWTGDEAEVTRVRVRDDGNVRIEFDDEWAVKREMKRERRELRKESRRDKCKDDEGEEEETEDGGNGKGKGKAKEKIAAAGPRGLRRRYHQPRCHREERPRRRQQQLHALVSHIYRKRVGQRQQQAQGLHRRVHRGVAVCHAVHHALQDLQPAKATTLATLNQLAVDAPIMIKIGGTFVKTATISNLNTQQTSLVAFNKQVSISCPNLATSVAADIKDLQGPLDACRAKFQ